MLHEILNKEILRKKTLAARTSPDLEEKSQLEVSLCHSLISNPLWKNARVIAAYMSLPEEISTLHLLKWAWLEQKLVYLPRLTPGEKGKMDFYKCSGFNELKKGRFGLLEPAVEMDSGDSVPDLVLVPGLAFDYHGNRLGYGGGYYDRFLTRKPQWQQVCYGVAFRRQIHAELPSEEHDVKMRGIFTDEGLIWIPR